MPKGTLSSALCVLVLGTAVLLSAKPSPPALGPGAVLALHEDLFRALDRGDGKAVAALIVDRRGGLTWEKGTQWGDPGSFLAFATDPGGDPLRADSSAKGLTVLERWADEGWSTEIERAWTDCQSPELSYAILEIARTRVEGDRSTTQRFRSTSLVSYDERANHWSLWHIHLSPVR